MVNTITKETWDLWLDNIDYIINHSDTSEKASEEILNYLEGEGAFAKERPKLTDKDLEEKWAELSDIPFNETESGGDIILAVDWEQFPKGTEREEIWKWFDKHHSKGVHCLLYNM